jgi:hypothetical protein
MGESSVELNGEAFTHCDRCNKETRIHTMSMFNCDLICMACKAEERKDPRYKEAVEADNAEIKKGNFNYKGIGK